MNRYNRLSFLCIYFLFAFSNILYSQSDEFKNNIFIIRNDSVFNFNGKFIYKPSFEIAAHGFFAKSSGFFYTVKLMGEEKSIFELFKIKNDSIKSYGEYVKIDSVINSIFKQYVFNYFDYGIVNLFNLAIDSSQFVYTTSKEVVYCTKNTIDTIAKIKGKRTFWDCYSSPYIIKKDSTIIYIRERANNINSNILCDVFLYNLKTKKTIKLYKDNNVFDYYPISKELVLLLKGNTKKKNSKDLYLLKKGKHLLIKHQVDCLLHSMP